MANYDNTLTSANNNRKLKPLSYFPLTNPNNIDNWAIYDFVNLTTVEPSLGIPDPNTNSINSLSSYYFPLFNEDTKSRYNSKAFTGNDNLYIKNKNLSYAHNNPTFNFDISGTLRSTFSFFPLISTNLFLGKQLNFEDFDSITFNSDISAKKKTFFNNLSVNNFLVTKLTEPSSLYITIEGDPNDAAQVYSVFSSINWNVTAGNNFYAKDLKINSNLNTSLLTANNSFFINLTADTVYDLNDINHPSSNVFYNNKSSNKFIGFWISYFTEVKPINNVASPNNTNDIWKLTESKDNDIQQHFIYQQILNLNQGDTFTLSVYAKAAERYWLTLVAYGEPYAFFNLKNGNIIGDTTKASMQNVGNGWWRCSYTFTKSNSNNQVYIGINTGTGSNYYVGDGASGLYIWGAQLERGSVLTPYSGYGYGLSLSATNINAQIQIDPNFLAYENGNTLTTKLSSFYFFGIKPSDTHATDDIRVIRTIDGNWDGNDGSIIETLPVCKPYFKNLKPFLDYVYRYQLRGEQLSLLIYEDYIPDNTNNFSDSRYQNSTNCGCTFAGNLTGVHLKETDTYFPTGVGLHTGDFIWAQDLSQYINGGINYFNVGPLNFKQFNIAGMYEIGSLKNADGKKEYSLKKPFNFSPRKLTFRTYICSAPPSSTSQYVVGHIGSDPNVWKNLSLKNKTFNRQVSFGCSKYTTINIQNLCFEFDGNANDSTGLQIYEDCIVYLRNVTVAVKGNNYYPYGAVAIWPASEIHICGETQLDPYLLTPSTYNLWQTLSSTDNPYYFPGYGLAIVGNDPSEIYPTLLNTFFTTWGSLMDVMDYDTNRRIGKKSYLNSSIILDGCFNSWSFYNLNQSSRLYNTNYVFRTNNLKINTYKASLFGDIPNYTGDVNIFDTSSTRDNFYYVHYGGSFSTFKPRYFPLNTWTFDRGEPILYSNLDKNQFTKNNNHGNGYYQFNANNTVVNLSGFLVANLYFNELVSCDLLSDNTYLYNCITYDQLPLYDMAGYYKITSPIDNRSTYTLNFYASGSPTILPKN